MISVIVLSYNDAEYARNCIKSIKEKTYYNYEIILVNNGSNIEHTKILDSIEVNHYIKMEENKGLPAGYNLGINLAIKNKAEYVCLMNADTRVETIGWLKNMTRIFRQNEKTGMVAAMTNKIANRKQNWKSYGNKLPIKIIEANWVGLGMTLIPTEVIKQAGLLDEKMGFGGGVDAEYSLRLRKAGYRIFVDGTSYVWHKGKVAFEQLDIPYKTLQKTNIKYIKEKYPNTWKEIYT